MAPQMRHTISSRLLKLVGEEEGKWHEVELHNHPMLQEEATSEVDGDAQHRSQLSPTTATSLLLPLLDTDTTVVVSKVTTLSRSI